MYVAILSQIDSQGILLPTAFYSKKMSPAQINYKIHNKKLLAIVSSFMEWRQYLGGSSHQIKVLGYYKNQEHFMTDEPLNRRQARCTEDLSSQDFQIVYRPGTQRGKPDALTRQSEDQLRQGDQMLEHQKQTVLKPWDFAEKLRLATTATSEAHDGTFLKPIRKEQ